MKVLNSEIYKELGTPSLLVHLRCYAKTELERIPRRRRKEEDSINFEFLAVLNQGVENEVLKVQNKWPVLAIASSLKDFADDEKVKKELTSLISDFISTNP